MKKIISMKSILFVLFSLFVISVNAQKMDSLANPAAYNNDRPYLVVNTMDSKVSPNSDCVVELYNASPIGNVSWHVGGNAKMTNKGKIAIGVRTGNVKPGERGSFSVSCSYEDPYSPYSGAYETFEIKDK